jgi:hypothetical protein
MSRHPDTLTATLPKDLEPTGSYVIESCGRFQIERKSEIKYAIGYENDTHHDKNITYYFNGKPFDAWIPHRLNSWMIIGQCSIRENISGFLDQFLHGF